nr:hypothetical protein [Tanacetum cinerariifolium]
MPQCGVILLNGIRINCTYEDGKSVTCCKFEGSLRGGFCLFYDLKDSFTKAYSFNDTSNNFNHLPQAQFENYLCKLCGNNSHDGYDCQQQFPFVYEQELKDKRECDVLIYEDSFTFDGCDDHSENLSDSNNDDILSDDNAFEDIEYVEASLPVPKLVSLEEENVVYQAVFS